MPVTSAAVPRHSTQLRHSAELGHSAELDASPPTPHSRRGRGKQDSDGSARAATAGGAHPRTVGWWHPPKASSRAQGTRHRSEPEAPGPAPRRYRRRRLRQALLGAAVLAVLGPGVAFVVGYLLLPVPTPDEVVDRQVTVVSYADGSPLTRLVPEQSHRREVPVEAVPLPVREAVLAARDRSFYDHREFDLTGTLRSAWNRTYGVDTGRDPGPSTITEQYVGTALGGAEGSLWRTYRELVVSVKLARQRPKDQLLGDYLNAIYFGRGAYGIQAAAQAYFGKDAADLTVAEGAVLAEVIGAPAGGDPAVSLDHGVQRWNSVLDGMVAQGWLTAAQRADLRFPSTLARNAGVEGLRAGAVGPLVDAVVDELADIGVTERDVAQQGLRVTTTLDPTRQRQAVAATRDAHAPTGDRTALVALDPQTGGMLAYRGGEDPADGAPDGSPDNGSPAGDFLAGGSSADGGGSDEARVGRPAGATFAPFAVLASLQHDSGSGDEPPDAHCRGCDVAQAMARDGDGLLKALARRVGPQAVAGAARTAGISVPLDDRVGAGMQEVSAVDLASAYAAIAAGGVWHRPHLVSTVAAPDGRVLYRAPTDGGRRFSAEVARAVTEAMLDVAAYRGVTLPDARPVAMATDSADTWTVGFIPSLVTVVWRDRDPLSPPSIATGPSGKTWHDFVAAAVADLPAQEFPPPHPSGAPTAAPRFAPDQDHALGAMPTRRPTNPVPVPAGPVVP